MKTNFLKICSVLSVLLLAVCFLFAACEIDNVIPGLDEPDPEDDDPMPDVDPVATGQKTEEGKWLNVRPGHAPAEIRPSFGTIMDEGGSVFLIRPNVQHQTMTGFGASDAWIVNFLFGGGVDPTGQLRYGPDLSASPYNGQTYAGMHEAGKQQVSDWLFSQEFDEITGEPVGIGLSQWRVYVGAGSWEQGNNSRIGINHATNFANMGSNWQNRAESLLYDIRDPMGTTSDHGAAVNAAIDGVNVVKHPISGIIYDFRKMKGNQYVMNEARKRGTENFIVFTKSVTVPWTRNTFANSGNFNATLINGRWLPADRVPNVDTNNQRGNGPGELMYAHYMTDAAEYFTNQGYYIQFISPFNEPQYEWNENKQEGSPGENRVMARIVRHMDAQIQARPAISATGGTDVKIMLSEAARWDYLSGVSGNAAGSQIQAFFNPVYTNPNHSTVAFQNSYVGGLKSMQPAIIAGHTYFSHRNDTDTINYRTQVRNAARAFTPSVQIYQTEWCALEPGSGFPNVNTYYRNALFNAKLTHQDITIMDAVSYTYWTAISFDHGHARYGLVNNSPGVSQYDGGSRNRFSVFHNESYNKTQPPLWGTGHWSLFVRPGFKRIALTEIDGRNVDAPMGLMGTAYISPTGFREFERYDEATGQRIYKNEEIDRIVAVYVNMGTSSRWVAANISGTFEPGRVYGGTGGKHAKYIRVFLTDFNNTESSSQSIIFREGIVDPETGEIPAVTAAVRNNKDGAPSSGYGMRRQLHDNGLIFIPRESIVTVVYDF